MLIVSNHDLFFYVFETKSLCWWLQLPATFVVLGLENYKFTFLSFFYKESMLIK